MNLLKEVLKNQVFPALGCTEPVSVALCGAYAAQILGEKPQSAVYILDSGTYKNGMSVALPNTAGGRGNLLAGAIGLLAADPGPQMELLKSVTPRMVAQAKKLAASGKIKLVPSAQHKGFYIEARVKGKKRHSCCIIAGGHTRVAALKSGNRPVSVPSSSAGPGGQKQYLAQLAGCSLLQLARLAGRADSEDLAYIAEGVNMNLRAAQAGLNLKKVGFYLRELRRRGFLLNDVFATSKIMAACAVDARMEGLPVTVMSSGESGNQGIVASLVPYNVGLAFGIPRERIYKSIALSHLMNAYVKVYTGGLSPICGCAIAAGVGAAAGIVYQLKGADAGAIGLAVNNVISDLGGMLCDGAKSGCALKVVSSADSAIRSAYMGVNRYGITEIEGFVGATAEETIRNLGRISTCGMGMVDTTIVDIMRRKSARR